MLQSLRLAGMLAWVALSSAAFAQGSEGPTPAQIRAAAEAFDLGREAYQAREYVNAAEQFERADSQAPSSTALEYAIRAREKAGQLDRAATLAVLGRERHPEEANLKKLVPSLLDRAQKDLFELTVECAEPCELAVGGKIVHGAPNTRRMLYLLPGAHTVRAGFSGDRSASRDVRAEAGKREQTRLEPPVVVAEVPSPPAVAPPQATPSSAPSAASETRGWSPTVFWIGAGLTAAAGAATIWSGIDTLNNPGEDRVQQECDVGDENCPLYQEGLRSQRRTNVLIGVTAGLGVGTALVGLLATDWGSRGRAAAVSVPAKRRGLLEPWLVIGESAFVGARGRF